MSSNISGSFAKLISFIILCSTSFRNQRKRKSWRKKNGRGGKKRRNEGDLKKKKDEKRRELDLKYFRRSAV